MRPRRQALLAAALAALVALAGCSALLGAQSDDQTQAPDISAEQLQDDVQAAMQDVRSYDFELSMTVRSNNATVLEMDGEGTVDNASRRLYFTGTVNALGREVNVTQYIVDGTMYIKSGGRWQTRPVSGMGGFQGSSFTGQQRLLTNGSITVNGTTTVDGERVYRLEVDATEEAIRRLLQRQGTQSLPENVEIEGLAATMYVSVDSKRLKRFEATVDMTSQGQPTTVSISMTLTDYNVDPTIQPPAKATA